MKISELIHEGTDKPLELRDIIKFFPNTYARVMKAKWGGGQLVFHGHPFFSARSGTHSLGSAYEGAEGAVDLILADDYRIEVPVTMDLRPLKSILNSKKNIEPSYDFMFEATISDKQEVYLGYSPSDDSLYIGYDMWINDGEFNEAWDHEFRSATGVDYDPENPEHEAVFNSVWQKQRDNMFFGGLFHVTEHYNKWNATEVQITSGGFYKGIYRTPFFRNLDLVDLQLD
jgi:hypothetical protein